MTKVVKEEEAMSAVAQGKTSRRAKYHQASLATVTTEIAGRFRWKEHELCQVMRSARSTWS